MNANIKKIWLKALRSGEYEQTTTRLCRPRSDGVGFCCLGVLCDLSDDCPWMAVCSDRSGAVMFSHNTFDSCQAGSGPSGQRF